MVLALAAAALVGAIPGAPLSQTMLMDARRLTGNATIELRTMEGRDLPPGHLRLEQSYRGYRVLNTKLTAEVDAFGHITRIDQQFKQVSGDLPPVNVSVQQAMRTAFAKAGVDLDLLPTPTLAARDTLAIFAEGSKPLLVYELPVLSVNPFDRITTIVDATSGKIVRSYNATLTADTVSNAKVFDPNPRTSPTPVTKSITTSGTNGATQLIGTKVDTRNCKHQTSDDLEYYVVPFPTTGDFAQYKTLISAALGKQIDWVVVPLCKEVSTASPAQATTFAAEVGAQNTVAAQSDKFAEVNFYYHADRVAKYFSGAGAGNLNAGFAGRANEPLQGTVNFMIPAISTAICTIGRYTAPANPLDKAAVRAAAKLAFETRNQQPNVAFGGQTIAQCSTLPSGNPGTSDFTAFDNAFFMPKADSEMLGPLAAILGDFRPYDSMVFGQGTSIDFAYDSSVIYHEYTHAVVNSVDALQAGIAADKFGLDYAPGAMNEGIADYFASVLNPTLDGCMGPYSAVLVGNGVECLRDLQNDAVCPDYLVGEVHEDSLAFSAALWSARGTFASASDKELFDRSAFETLDAMTNDAQFAAFFGKLLIQMKSHGLSTTAASEIFTQKNVLNCERVIALAESTESKQIGLAGTGTSGGDFAPGFVQYRLQVPKLTKQVLLSVDVSSAGGQIPSGIIPGGGNNETQDVRILLSVGKPVEFTEYPTDANKLPKGSEEFELKKNNTVKLEITKQTDGDWYIAFVNYNNGGHNLDKVTFEVTDAFEDKGAGPQGQTGPTGVVPSTGPTDTGNGLLATPNGNTTGCACGQTEVSVADASGILALAALVLALRRRRGHR